MAPTHACARGHDLALAPEAPPYRCRDCVLALREAAARSARDPFASPHTLRRLATSRWLTVRCAVAANPLTPADVLASMLPDDGRVALALAGNPMLPSEAGRRLAQHPSVHVRRALVANPAAPLAVCESLGARHPRELMRNAAWRLLLRRAPERVLRGGRGELLMRIVMARAAPRWLRAWAVERGDEKVRRELAALPALATELALRLVDDRACEVRERVAARGDLPGEALRALARDEDVRVRAAVARNPATPDDALVALARDASERVRDAVASNPAAPAEALRSLAGDARHRVAVARNPAAPGDVIERLARSADDALEQAVASNRGADTALLARLARWRYRYAWRSVRVTVAANPSAPAATLRRVAMARQYTFRAAAARNPRCPGDALRALADDRVPYVRRFARRALLARRR